MNCLEPYVSTGGVAFPCGKCPSCVATRRKVWANRIMLESMQWQVNSFCTLTYSEETCPLSLNPMDLTLFLKRLRGRWKSTIRYYAVGEYSPSMRPHFHLALFNYPMCQSPTVRRFEPCPCTPCSVVREAWSFGHILLGSLEQKSAQYIAGYVTQKLARRDQKLASLDGRLPEFSRMSLRPGIGAGATWDVASVLLTYPRIYRRQGDVPTMLRHGTRQLPLGAYLRRLIRKRIGVDENAPPCVVEAAKERLRVVFDYAAANAAPQFRREIVKAVLGDLNEQFNRNVSARSQVRGSYR